MHVHPATVADGDQWLAQRAALWPEAEIACLREDCMAFLGAPAGPLGLQQVLLCRSDDGTCLGFIEISLRSYAEGCETSQRIAYIEGLYTVPEARRSGVARRLMHAAETWARDRGHRELASGALLGNTEGIRAHLALGFEEVERQVHFRKDIGRPDG